jgi:gluconate 2-dehydrogenase gamma chain
MSDLSRRTVLRNVAVTALAGGIPAAEAQHVHQMSAGDARKSGGVYKPKVFNAREWATLRRLCDLIFPADGHSKGALEGGAPEFIDLLASHNDEIAAIYTGGLAWLDREMERRHSKSFMEAAVAQQTELLDLIAYRKNATPETAAGVRFFEFARKMTADAYYTSKAGIADLGFMGNQGQATFQVPVEAVQYALKRSGL